MYCMTLLRTCAKWFTLSQLFQTSWSRSTRTSFSTVTVTTQLSSIPTVIPSYDGYKLQGCFGGPRSGGVGELLDKDYIMPTNATASEQMTIPVCIVACLSSKPANGSAYNFVGLGGGKECYCAGTLSSSSHSVADTNCSIPCAGDNSTSCGGDASILIYTYASTVIHHDGGDPGSTITSDTNSAPQHEAESPPSSSGNSVAVIIGTLFGVVSFLACLFIAYKIYRRRIQAQREAALAAQAHSTGHTREKGEHPVSPLSGGQETPFHFSPLDTAIINGRFSPAISPVRERRRSSNSPTTIPQDASSAAATSAVQPFPWMQGRTTPEPATPSTGYLSVSSGIISEPEPTAEIAGLGDRAWHRRKLSQKFPPAVGGGQLPAQQVVEEEGQAANGGQETERRVSENCVPAPLNLPNRGGGMGEDDEEMAPLVPTWTIWTLDGSLSASVDDAEGVGVAK